MLTTLKEWDRASIALNRALELGYSKKLARLDAGLDQLFDRMDAQRTDSSMN